MKKILLSLILLIIGLTNIYATHNRAGEITYKHIPSSGTNFRYGITITTYTNTLNTLADRCEVLVNFGDGSDSLNAPRTNGPSILCSSTHDGVMLTQFPNTKLNIYYIEHTYPGIGDYLISMDDPNRNAGTCNIPNSVNTSFSLVSELIINPFLGFNDSPVLLSYPLDHACVGECFFHNTEAWDDNGDSLYYRLDTCFAGGVHIPGWTFPPNMSNQISINHFTGDIAWCSPSMVCQYSIAIRISEFRRLPGSPLRYYIGFVLRDMQITVGSCINNPPTITQLDDTCVVAGTNLHFNVHATDVENDVVTLEGNGGPFHLIPAATFPTVSAPRPVTGTFNWTPNCSEVQLLPYLVTFKATDSDPGTPLVDYKSMFIRVIAPAVTGLTATPSGASIIVTWNADFCSATIGNNQLLGYKLYRKNSCDSFVHDICATGLPSTAGYTLITTTLPGVTTYTDNNNGIGLFNGINYSYIVVAFYTDGSQSYASGNVCAMLLRDVPIITNVSVTSTNTTNGTIWIHWIKPLAAPPNLDTVASPPPYEYRLMRATGMSGGLNFSQVSPAGSYTYPAYSQLPDTGFVDTGLNTQDTSYTYRVDFYSNGILKGSTNTASSVFLSSSPAGNQVHLSWHANVPWANYKYNIYKETVPGSLIFDSINTTSALSYIDSSLANGHTYCYKVVTIGQYSDITIPRPLYNTSEIKCEVPRDVTPPCQPPLVVENDCGAYQDILNWTNPNTICCHDAVSYKIYFSPTTNGDLQLIYTIADVNITTYSYTDSITYGVPSIAGCYAVTALDTAGNESPIVTKTCIDNCPIYELPNVFTPNGDNVNDFVTPLPGYRYVKDVDMTIYDRWGLIMFHTTDKNILWDGRNKDTKGICPDGTYFYICTVNEIHVDGIEPRTLKGFIQLFKEKTNTPR